jgi:hypothetical protein
MSSTHCVDNFNQVHIQNEDGIEEHCLNVHEEQLSIEEEEEVPIEEGKDDNLEGAKFAPATKAYLDAKKRNIEHLQATMEKFGVLVVVQEL